MVRVKRQDYSYRDDPAVPRWDDSHGLIVFDGVCILCAGFVQFVLRNDARGYFRFTTGQSPLGQALYKHWHLPRKYILTAFYAQDMSQL